ncbi:MAG: translation initiation factor IF-2 subunit gamma [Candidatus Thermoplasmatota archaeon]|jgi:translation initiation factor 2 subunit 3|nr:translation initiation factor IF-2 subunit gamma [Candidatus Thermoplasmatota archaeon]MCL5988128.1 translation initiation factor IF-2 subunit gamma [Candidatus Thermoplasmatota archaeon]
MSSSLPQPTVNIGMVGHVDHGKSTLTKALTGRKTDIHSEEVKRGISIKLGYADTPVYICETGEKVYSGTKLNDDCRLSRVISFVDAPGHETLMATMLSGSSIMDGALLVIAANEKCPQPQTREHLTAIEIMGIRNIIIVQNKIDLVTKERAIESFNEIKNFVKGSAAENSPIIPVSAYHNRNIHKIFEAIETFIPTPERNLTIDPVMYVARSFDVNRPGITPDKLKGGVLGGSLTAGIIKVGQEIEIAPGIKQIKGNKETWENVLTECTTLMAGSNSYETIIPGGLSAVGTKLDPSITKNDGLAGRIMSVAGKAPPVTSSVEINTNLLKRVVGFENDMNVEPIKTRESLMLTFGTSNTLGVVTNSRESNIEISLRIPVAVRPDERVAIARRIANRWRLIGYGNIVSFA